MKRCAFTITLFAFLIYISSANITTAYYIADINLPETSQELLLQAKKDEPADSLVELIKEMPAELLAMKLKNDNDKKAFWINIYNACTQIILKKNPGKYKNRSFFWV